MSERPNDREDLAAALRIIRKAVPSATSIVLDTSDQGYVGFTLSDVTLPGGLLSDLDEALLETLQDEVWPLVSSLGWNGLIGEDKYGNATVRLDSSDSLS